MTEEKKFSDYVNAGHCGVSMSEMHMCLFGLEKFVSVTRSKQ